MAFRPRDYIAEQESHAIPRSRADYHPLSAPPPSLHNKQAAVLANSESNDFFDPLRAPEVNASISFEDTPDTDNATSSSGGSGVSSEANTEVPSKEWTSFKRFLMQKFPVSKMISVSSMSDVIIKTSKAFEKSSKNTHLEELEDPQKIFEGHAQVITRQEYVSRLHELKDEITRAWRAEDRVTALKLSIKVAKLLMDTSVLQFYPTLFVLVTDVMDRLGDMVWERIKRRAEFSEDGTFLCSLPGNFKASDIRSEAKETCYNWFCKVGAIRELLPHIYLELAILPCSHYLLDQPEESLQRLVKMIRGLGDPLASAYCSLYMVHCARKLGTLNKGYLVMCVNDIKTILMRLSSAEETPDGHHTDKKRLIFSLMEPTIEYIMKCIFEDASQSQVDSVLKELGVGRSRVDMFGSPCASIVLHHLLKELPTEIVGSNAMDILHLIRCSNDYSFDQCLNYRLLGFKLCESSSHMDAIHPVLDEVIQVVTQSGRLDEYLKVVDAYIDIVLQNQLDNYLTTILEGLLQRACNKEIVEDELGNLQSILMKFLSHFKDLNDVLALNHFLEILDVMYGSSRSVIDMHILNMATRNGGIYDPTTIQLLFEISQSLHDAIDFANIKYDDSQQPAHLISRFIQLVDFGSDFERHLMFLVECRAAFCSMNELKETLVHSSNSLAIKALRDGKRNLTFVKSCITFSEITIPSISAPLRQLNLYLETAEVALLGGLLSHSDGLVDSAVTCLDSVDLTDGSRMAFDADGILSPILKLCSLLVIVPGNPELGVMKVPESILSLVYSKSWMTPRMKTRTFCAIVLLLATLSQNKLPYHAYNSEIIGNDLLFSSDLSYLHELSSLSKSILKNLVNAIEQEPSKAARGSMALEACNCIASSFQVSDDILQVSWKLVETARSCLSANDKYLQSTIKYLEVQLPTSQMVPSMAT